MNINSEIGNQLQNIADYREHVANNNLIWMLRNIEFVATGHGGASIAMDAVAYRKVELKEYTRKGFNEFCKAE